MRFTFVGNFDIKGENPEKGRPGCSFGKTKNGVPYFTVRPTVVAGKANSAFCEHFAMKNSVIKTKDKEGKEIEIDYADVNDKGVIENVAFYKLNIIDFDGERTSYVSDYDFAKQIWDGADEYKGKRFTFTGDVNKNIYNGKITNTYTLKNMYQVKEDDDKKNGFELVGEFYWTKDSVDTSDFKKEKVIYFDGWTREWVPNKDKIKESDPDYQYFPMRAILNCKKIDFENEKHVKIMNFRLKNMGLLFEDNKITNNLKKGKVYKNNIVFAYSRGAEEIEFDASQLTAAQKEAVELGLKKPEDFAPKGNIYGDFKEEYRIKDFPMTDAYADGMVTTEESWGEFEDLIYMPVASKEEQEAFEEAVNPPEEEKNDDDEISEDELDDLFD